MSMKIAGRFKLEAYKLDGSHRVVADWFDNLILDAGLDRIGAGAPITHCMVGSGSAAPANGQTALGTQIASTSTVQSTTTNVELASGYSYLRKTFRFGVGAAAGNLSEVGTGWSSLLCFSRALIVDGGGAPTTITILADEILDVTYELRFYWPTVDVVDEVVLDGVTYDFTLRASNVGSGYVRLANFDTGGASIGASSAQGYHSGSLAALGDLTTIPGGTQNVQNLGTAVVGAYSNGTFYRDYRISANTSQMIVPISALRLNSPFGDFKVGFDPVIPKSNTNTLTFDIRITWARRVL